MIKILNKFILILKNIILPIIFVATIYIVMLMFQRLQKEVFGENLKEFLEIALPFLLLMILNLLNIVLKQKEVKDNIFYNITSFLVMVTIAIFCYRAMYDKNMYLWHKYKYLINFNYFSDQIAAIKVMLYGLSIGNVLLMISDRIKLDEDVNKKQKIKS